MNTVDPRPGFAGPSPAARHAQARAHRLVPGGGHTYAKGDDQYPHIAPPILVRGFGSRVVDIDGNEFVEYGGGMRSNLLGHAHPRVVEAVCRAVGEGTNFVRPSLLEADTAEDLLAFIGRPDWMAKFTKNGSDANDAAIRLARAVTGRDRVLYCASQPFFSVADWFIGTTPMNAGVPRAVMDLVVGFPYGDADALRDPLAGGDVAAVILEAAKYDHPPDGYLQAVADACAEHGTLLILDEMITGLRWPGGSAMACYGVEPDLATFGKALGNGVGVSALVGRRELMMRGGTDHDHERVFMLSTTHGADHTGLAAARAVLAEARERDVAAEIAQTGRRLADELSAISTAKGVADHLVVHGLPQALVFATRGADGQPSQPMRALVMQELIRHGVLGPSLILSGAHDATDLEVTATAWEAAADAVGRALQDGPEVHLLGDPTQEVFKKVR